MTAKVREIIVARRQRGEELTRREIERPSFPPKLPYNMYPKRCPCGALIVSQSAEPGPMIEIVKVRCANGHEWKEARCEPI